MADGRRDDLLARAPSFELVVVAGDLLLLALVDTEHPAVSAATTSSTRPADASSPEAERAIDRQMRVMARTLLDGYPAGKLQTRFPGATQLLEAVRPAHDDDRSASMAVANALALQLGWRLFAPFLRSAAGLEELTDAELRQALTAEVARIVQPHTRRVSGWRKPGET